ncbi:MAG: hypothetical protein JSS86_12655 [Cyanobacteria bacterium SZAS LIN-2]|nr:hypothetical protein [Cyanobacteria bacterium SZAS LIN-2]
MKKKIALGAPFAVSLLILTACSGSKEAATTSTPGATSPTAQTAAPAHPVRVMQPLQPGQGPQKPAQSYSKTPAIQGGQPGTTALPYMQPFRLGDLEYQFMDAAGKQFVGLKENPSMHPSDGNVYFLVRYQVINHGQQITIPNQEAVHLMQISTKQVMDIDQAATNANVMSGAATGLPDEMTLDPEVPNVQTLVFQMPNTVAAEDLQVLVTEPKDPTHVFQLVKLSN